MRFLALIIVMALGGASHAYAEAPPETMSALAPGTYTPQFKSAGKDAKIAVSGFWLDKYPVTNAEFLAFVRAETTWQRERIPAIFAEGGYLNHWAGAMELGPLAPPESPVVNVSWFAARAYCEWKGKELPAANQWEYAAAADEKSPDAATSPAFYTRILRWYGKPGRQPLPAVGSTRKNLWGVWDLHGLVWEWVDDFSLSLATGTSRGDGTLDKNLYCGSGGVGATDFKNYASFMRYAFRNSLQPQYTVNNLGFRCAAPLESQP